MENSAWYTNDKPRRQKRREYILSKKDVPCADCGQRYPACVMDFHHLDEELKDAVLKKKKRGMLEHMSKWSEKRIDAELAGCVVLCANCHRMRHYAFNA